MVLLILYKFDGLDFSSFSLFCKESDSPKSPISLKYALHTRLKAYKLQYTAPYVSRK
jgi:hypothetical protein